MPRIQGLQESGCLTEDQLLKTGEGYVFSVTIGYTGVTKGQHCLLRDGVSGAAKPLVVFKFGDTSGTITKEWPQGKKFIDGLWYGEGATGGEVWFECTFK